MLIINIKDNETIDRALGRYKKKIRDTQLLKEVRRRKSFEKPSVTRRGQVLKAVHKLQVQREAIDQ
jgi:small subunit ribosomal protein S21